MWLLLSALARAHSPHDVASLLSQAPDGALLTNDSDVLAWTDAATQAFTYVVAPGDQPACAVARSRTTLVIGDEDGLWWSGDGGLSFLSAAGPGAVVDCLAGEEALLALSPADGLWTSEEGKAWDPLLRNPGWRPVRGAALPGGWLVLDDEGGLHLVDESGDTPLEGPLFAVGLSVDPEDPDRWLIGEAEGPPLLTEDGGRTWSPLPDGPVGATVLHLRGETLLLATISSAVWVSEDGGASFRLDDQGLDDLALGGGGPHDGVHYFHLAVDDDRWRLASFEGLYAKAAGSDDPWQQAPLDVIPRARSVDWLGEDRLLVGAYGGGVYEGNPGEADWVERSAGVGWPWPKQILAGDADGQWLFEVTGTILALSEDGGLRWTTAQTGLVEAGDVVTLSPGWPDDRSLAVAGRTAEGRAAVAFSEDAGATWALGLLPGSCTAKPSAMAWGEAGLLVSCGVTGALSLSEDQRSFEPVATLGAEVKDIALGPETLLAASAGLYRLGPTGPVRLAAEGEQVDAVAYSAAGEAVWFAVSGQGLFTGATAESAEAVGFPLGDRVEDIDLSEAGAVAIATRQGAFFRAVGSGAWKRANAYDRVDDGLQFWMWRGFAPVERTEATAREVHRGEVGAQATLTVEAAYLRLLGSAFDGAALSLSIDGGPAERLELADAAARGVLWEAALEPGVHDVVFTVESGVVELDGAERWTEGAPPPWQAPTPLPGDEAPKGRCGCAQSAEVSGGGLLLLIAALTARRRSPAR